MDKPSPLLTAAVDAFRRKDYQKSVQYFSKIIAADGKHFKALDGRTQVYMKLQKREPALRDAEALVKFDPTNAKGYYYTAKVFSEMGKPSMALKICQLAKKKVLPTDSRLPLIDALEKELASVASSSDVKRVRARANDETGVFNKQIEAENIPQPVTINLGPFSLPLELLTAIHLYLPFESLVRLTSVCRGWRTTVVNTHFLWHTLAFTSRRTLTNAQLITLLSRSKNGLKSLTLSSCPNITNPALKALTLHTCKNLTHLAITSTTKITPAAFAETIPMMGKSLTDLTLSETLAEDQTVRRVLNICPNLTHLTLAKTSVTNHAFQICDKFAEKNLQLRLQHLDVSGCRDVSDRALYSLSRVCPDVRYLDLTRTGVTKATLVNLAHFGKIETLILGGGQNHLKLPGTLSMGDAMLTFVSGEGVGESLRCLRVSYMPEFGDESVGFLASFCSRLEEVEFEWCGGVGDGACGSLASGCEGLKSVKLVSCPRVSDVGAVALVTGLKGLEALSLANNSQVGDAVVAAVVEEGRELVHLDLGNCVSVSGGGVARLTEKVGKRIQYLNLDNCSGVHHDTVAKLRASLVGATISARFS
ncbi:F-box/LRR-repeat protein 5 [Rhizophlyctis rosea]|nr:F-box/LRR-repeat protein 5 [Rhizophlyctis rosea]